MLLAIDIGNSTIKFGVFDGSNLLHKFSIATKRDYTVEELKSDRLTFIGTRVGPIDRVIISSVVPDVDIPMRKACRQIFKVTPIFVNSSTDLGLKIKYEPPSAAGTDRLVNAFAASEKYGRPVIVCSLGTATTVDIVTEKSAYIGGAIAPGMVTMAEALHLKAAKLPKVKIERPETVVANTTTGSIRSGIYFGYVGLVEGLVRRFLAEPQFDGHSKPRVIATGGFAGLVAEDTNIFDVVDENLTLDGLRLIADRY